MSHDFLNPRAEIEMHGSDLPHWQQDSVLQFVTFRLKDSVPQTKLRQWQALRGAWLARHPKPWDDKTRSTYNEDFVAPFENWLDQGMGSCLLKEVKPRMVLEQVLQHDAKGRADFISWVIMPNHVHLLFRPHYPLPKLIGNWKSYSARGIGKGSIWQRNYRDTLIRNSRHYAAAVRYIRKNPTHLPEGHYSLFESNEARMIV